MLYPMLFFLLFAQAKTFSVEPEYTIAYTFHGLENISDVDEVAFLRDPYGTLTECWDRGCDNLTVTMTLVELKQTAPWSWYEDEYPVFEAAGKVIGIMVGKKYGIPGMGTAGKEIGRLVGAVVCVFGCKGKADPPPDSVPPNVTCPRSTGFDTDKLLLTGQMMFPKATADDDVDGDVSHSLILHSLANQLIPDEVMPGLYKEDAAPHDFYVYRFTAKDKEGNIGFCDFQITVTLLSCERPDQIDHGFHLADTYIYGANADFVCNTGYEIKGSSSSECQKKQPGIADWSSNPPTCPAISCAALQDIAYGSLSCWHADGGETCSYGSCQFLSQCRYSCAPGFQIPSSQRAHLVCEHDGEWNGPVPQCVDYELPVLMSCPDSIVQEADQFVTSAPVSWTPPEYTDNSGQEVDVMMLMGKPPGSTFEEGTHQIMYAGVDPSGNRNTECSFKVDVRVNRCQKLMATMFMEDPICSHGNIYGSLCTFSCLPGADLLGSDNATCAMTGDPEVATWQFPDAAPACRARKCNLLTLPKHGHLSCGEWFDGDMCLPSCSDKYSLPSSFPDMYYCGILSGTWQPSIPMEDCTPMLGNYGFTKRYQLLFTNAPSEEVFASALNESMASHCTNLCTYVYTNNTQGYDVIYDLNGKRPITEVDEIFGNIEESLIVLMHSFDNTSSLLSSSTSPLCPHGYVASFMENGCVGCPVGQFYDQEQQDCSLCPVGNYQDEDTRVFCKSCPYGTSTHNKGATSVTQCEDYCKAGEISADGLIPCEACPRGYYQPHSGSTYCHSCPLGTTTLTEGSDKETMCQTLDITLDPSTQQIDLHLDTNHYTQMMWFYSDPLYECEVSLFASSSNENVSIVINNGTLYIGNMGFPVPLSKWSHFAVIKGYNTQLFLNGEKRYEGSENLPDGKLYIFPGMNCKGSFTALNVWNYAMEETDVIEDCSKCYSDSVGNALSWTELINRPYVTLMLQESICDDFDECQSNPCIHGTCNDHLGFFTCTCDDDYEGDLCEIKINHCMEHDCQNGATCVDGYMNYTCQCADKFTGFYCDDRIVNGGWSEWSGWTECSRTCGFGSKARSRDCINPVPQHGGMPCAGEYTMTSACIRRSCPECIPIRRPEFGNVTCEDDGEDITCEVYCLYNLDFAVSVPSNMTCGPSTNYMWPAQTSPWQQELTLPACTYPDMPTNLSLHTELVYQTLDCGGLQSRTEMSIQSSMSLRLQSLGCVNSGECRIEEVDVRCGTSSQFDVVHEQGTKVLVTIKTDVVIPPPIAYLTETNMEVNFTTKEFMAFADESGHNLANAIVIIDTAGEQIEKEMEDDQLVITIDGVEHRASSLDIIGEFSCQPGTVYHNKMCTVCPMGTFQSGSNCVACATGSFQPYNGQRNCTRCLEGNTTLNKGATSEEECILHCGAGTYHDNITCLTCPAGTYQPSEMQPSCKQCRSGMTSPEGATNVQQCQSSVRLSTILGGVFGLMLITVLLGSAVIMKRRSMRYTPSKAKDVSNGNENFAVVNDEDTTEQFETSVYL